LESTANGIDAHYRLKNIISTTSLEKSWEYTLCYILQLAILVKSRLVILISTPQCAVSIIIYQPLAYAMYSQLLKYLQTVCSISKYQWELRVQIFRRHCLLYINLTHLNWLSGIRKPHEKAAVKKIHRTHSSQLIAQSSQLIAHGS
jgi:hypothetical protein